MRSGTRSTRAPRPAGLKDEVPIVSTASWSRRIRSFSLGRPFASAKPVWYMSIRSREIAAGIGPAPGRAKADPEGRSSPRTSGSIPKTPVSVTKPCPKTEARICAGAASAAIGSTRSTPGIASTRRTIAESRSAKGLPNCSTPRPYWRVVTRRCVTGRLPTSRSTSAVRMPSTNASRTTRNDTPTTTPETRSAVRPA